MDNLYGDVKSEWFDPKSSAPAVVVAGRARLRMLVMRRGPDEATGTQLIQFKDGSSGGTVLYEIDSYSEAGSAVFQNQVVEMGENGILFPSGIYADYTSSTAWCDSVVMIYS